MRFYRLSVLTALLPLFTLAGCSMFKGKSDEPAYKSASTTKQLEVPPDLTRPEMDDTYILPGDERASAKALEEEESSQAAEGAQGAAPVEVLPEYPDMRIETDGAISWLVVKATPEELWPALNKFWAAQGLALKRSDPQLGIMETEWAERNLGVKEGGLKSLFAQSGFLAGIQDSGLRDKFFLRLSREEEGETAIFLTHKGAEQVPVSDTQFRWVSRPDDPHLIAETALSLMVFLGEKEEKATQMVKERVEKLPMSELVDYQDGPALRITGEEQYIWRRMGNVLDNSGLMVDDQDRKRGIYYITYLGDRAERGFMSKIFGSSDGPLEYEEEYQIRLVREGEVTYATAHDKDGKRLTGKRSREALELIGGAFN
jgi:outer membrane protein assembly factor BamC